MVLQTQRVPTIIFTLKTLIWLLCLGVINVKAQKLPDDEVEALKKIAKELGKMGWNFYVDPCGNDTSWETPPDMKLDPRSSYNNSVECNCAYPGAVCHVVGMFITTIRNDLCRLNRSFQRLFLKGQDLSGVLPTSLVNLPHITMIELSRNYLTGTIPSEWTSLKLERLSTAVNKLSGRIPSYLGKITTLRFLSIENNRFSGTVPPEIGKLVNLETLILNSNFLTGELPVNLTCLTNLTQLRISNNNFTGRIPDFFNSWKKLQKLEIQASGLAGPIPPSISVLSNLTELRISDLVGEGSIFPNLTSMTNMNRLMLRSCNLSGQIPTYISDSMPQLQTLDLSFNRLEGNVPEFDDSAKLQRLFLTRNLLNGTVPDWIKRRNPDHDLDLSYNNFLESSMPPSCRDTLNLFESFSGQDSSVGECPKNLPCSKDWNSVHINCGGNEVSIGNITYEADLDASGAANFHRTRENWGFSSTGNFWDDNSSSNAYIANNASELRMNSPELYTSARLSPLSLTYYARCLANGKYTVTLHFAEIIITGNRSFSSLGRRLFDVYIQGKLELKDFDIENTAGGVDKPLVQKVEAVVSNKILHIRFHWAGKGTTAAPTRGKYGLLISAISIEINDNPPDNVKTTIFIVTGALVLALLLILGILWWKGCIGSRISREKGETHQGFQCEENLVDNMNQDKLQELPIFSLKELASATNNFHQSNKLGQGGFGPVYKGKLLDGQEIAVKRLARSSRQGLEEFMNEVVVISKLQHRNLVRLLGGCVEGEEKLLVYEYMPNKSLDAFLFDPIKQELLDWKKRFNIIEGVGRGLLYLHRDSRLKIIHRDLKASNILLDEELNPKISDFGMAKIFGGNEDQANTKRIVGTYGYMSPEYAMEGRFSEKSDVFSFGVLLLEIVSGRKNTHFYHDEGTVSLVGLVWKMWNMNNLAALVDPKISRSGFENEIFRCIQVGLLCVQEFAKDRPTVSIVISMLKSEIVDLPYPRQPGFTVNQITSENEFSYPNQKVCSINNVTVSMVHDLRGFDLQTGFFTYRQIKAATNNFNASNMIGEGGFGSVYKGILLDGTIIAVKKLSSKSSQGNLEFENEIGMISSLQHPNVVRLYGACVEGNQLFLVYEYMENNSLARPLFGPEQYQLKLDWPTRQKICVGIARGPAFLHEESTLRIVYRDIKISNVQLDSKLNPKISDFGLAKLVEEENTHISTRVAGTIGYMAPEYALWGYLTYKADIYSFGVVSLEIVVGKSNMKFRPNESYVCLLDWALVLKQKGNLLELVDPKLDFEFNKEEAIRMNKVALLCTNPSPTLRPTMSAVVSMLEGQTAVNEAIMDPSVYGDDFKFKALRKQFDQIQHESMDSIGAENRNHSLCATWMGTSSTSTQYLYDPHYLDTQ